MGFVDYLIVAVIAAILGLVGLYIYKAKKKGKKCIGCPETGCAHCSCHCNKQSHTPGG